MNPFADESANSRLQQRLADGDLAAFGELYDGYADRLYRVAVRLLGSRDDAEDLVQELFLSLARSRKHLCRVENLPAYLFASLHRLGICAAQRRQSGPRGGLELDVPSEAPSAVAASDLRDQLGVVLQRLPLTQREVVVLKIDGELTFAEIAEALNIPANTAASRYRYAIEKLRAHMVESS